MSLMWMNYMRMRVRAKRKTSNSRQASFNQAKEVYTTFLILITVPSELTSHQIEFVWRTQPTLNK